MTSKSRPKEEDMLDFMRNLLPQQTKLCTTILCYQLQTLSRWRSILGYFNKTWILSSSQTGILNYPAWNESLNKMGSVYSKPGLWCGLWSIPWKHDSNPPSIVPSGVLEWCTLGSMGWLSRCLILFQKHWMLKSWKNAHHQSYVWSVEVVLYTQKSSFWVLQYATY